MANNQWLRDSSGKAVRQLGDGWCEGKTFSRDYDISAPAAIAHFLERNGFGRPRGPMTK